MTIPSAERMNVMMKLVSLLLAGIMFIAVPAIAQQASDTTSADTNLEILKQKLKADKKLIVASNMDLSDAEAKQFWPIYDSYQKDLSQVNQKLADTIKEYADAYNKGPVPNDKAKKLLSEALSVEEQETKLKRTYAEKLEKVIPPTKVARYIQIENKIRSLIKMELAQQIPLVY
jgi:hypothetical protein